MSHTTVFNEKFKRGSRTLSGSVSKWSCKSDPTIINLNTRIDNSRAEFKGTYYRLDAHHRKTRVTDNGTLPLSLSFSLPLSLSLSCGLAAARMTSRTKKNVCNPMSGENPGPGWALANPVNNLQQPAFQAAWGGAQDTHRSAVRIREYASRLSLKLRRLARIRGS
jgi:hypothetical protein